MYRLTHHRELLRIFLLTLVSCCVLSGLEAQVVFPVQPLDSMVYYDYGNFPDSFQYAKNEFIRDHDGNVVCQNYCTWNQQQNRWIISGKTESTFDEKRQLTGYTMLHWDTKRNVWSGVNPDGWYPKEEYFYDDRGNMIQRISYHWRSDLYNWEYVSKCRWTYDDAGNETSILIWAWDSELSTWICHFKRFTDYEGNTKRTDNYGWDGEKFNSGDRTDTVFDQHHRVDQVITAKWLPETDTWLLTYKKTYTYHDCGRVAGIQTQWWSNASQTWIDYTNGLYEVDSECNPVLYHCYKFDKASNEWWTTGNRTERTFDASGNCLVKIDYVPSSLNKWVPSLKTISVYDSGNHEISSETSKWNLSYKVWVNSSRVEKTYDAKGRENTTTEISWNSDLQRWIPMRKYDKKWNANGLQVLDAQFTRDPETGAWYTNSYRTWTFNDKGFKMVDETDHWVAGKGLLPSSRTFYYYEGFSGISEPVSDITLSVYPNPTDGVLSLGGISRPVDLQLFSITGQYIRTFYQVENSIELTELPDGQYIIKIWLANKSIKSVIISKQ